MLVQNYALGYSRKKKYIVGRGLVDALANVFNTIKDSAVPTMKSIGSYVSSNKDLIAKPLLGAVGSLAATGLTAGVPALLSHIMRRKDPKYQEIMQGLTPAEAQSRLETTPRQKLPAVTNIIGAGVRNKKRGGGIKKF